MKKATLINGDEVDLEKLKDYNSWIGEEEYIEILDINRKVITKIPVSTLISIWIEKEEEDYKRCAKN